MAAAQAAHGAILTSGLAGLVAGALSMAAGEYVSVRSQADTEAADLRLEQRSLKRNSGEELAELTEIYVQRGLSPDLAAQVASQLTHHDALDAHARDELGILLHNRARPVQAAVASAACFAGGAALPLAVAAVTPTGPLIWTVTGASIACLAALGRWPPMPAARPRGRPPCASRSWARWPWRLRPAWAPCSAWPSSSFH